MILTFRALNKIPEVAHSLGTICTVDKLHLHSIVGSNTGLLAGIVGKGHLPQLWSLLLLGEIPVQTSVILWNVKDISKLYSVKMQNRSQLCLAIYWTLLISKRDTGQFLMRPVSLKLVGTAASALCLVQISSLSTSQELAIRCLTLTLFILLLFSWTQCPTI